MDSSASAQLNIQYNNRVARRRTDLMPTIPAPREMSTSLHHAKSFTRSPGRAYSMTRLDQLAQPRLLRRVPTPELDVVIEHRPISMTRSYPANNTFIKQPASATVDNLSLSRSMTHLAGTKPLRKSDTSTSMLNISRPTVTPRMNKTERMRRQRLANANAAEDHSAIASQGKCMFLFHYFFASLSLPNTYSLLRTLITLFIVLLHFTSPHNTTNSISLL